MIPHSPDALMILVSWPPDFGVGGGRKGVEEGMQKKARVREGLSVW